MGGQANPPSYESFGAASQIAENAFDINFDPIAGPIGGFVDLSQIAKDIADKTQSGVISSSGQLNPGITGLGAGYSTPSSLSPEEVQAVLDQYDIDLEITDQRDFNSAIGNALSDARAKENETYAAIGKATDEVGAYVALAEYVAAKSDLAAKEIAAQQFYGLDVTQQVVDDARFSASLYSGAVEDAKNAISTGDETRAGAIAEGVISDAIQQGYLSMPDIEAIARDFISPEYAQQLSIERQYEEYGLGREQARQADLDYTQIDSTILPSPVDFEYNFQVEMQLRDNIETTFEVVNGLVPYAEEINFGISIVNAAIDRVTGFNTVNEVREALIDAYLDLTLDQYYSPIN